MTLLMWCSRELHKEGGWKLLDDLITEPTSQLSILGTLVAQPADVVVVPNPVLVWALEPRSRSGKVGGIDPLKLV